MSARLVDANALWNIPGYTAEFQNRVNKMPDLFTTDDLDGGEVKHVVHAHWISHEHAWQEGHIMAPTYECSNCHEQFYVPSKFCADCGSKMDEEME